jgi:hypothetical protein
VPDAGYEDTAAVLDQKQLADLTIAIGPINRRQSHGHQLPR